jgi:ribonuclease J
MIENGAVLRLAPGPAEIVGQVTSGRLAVDGKVLTPVNGRVMKARKKLAWNGSVVVTIVVSPRGTLAAPPRVVLQAVPDDAEPGVLEGQVETALAEVLGKLPPGALKNTELATEVARRAARHVVLGHSGKRVPVEVQIIPLPG